MNVSPKAEEILESLWIITEEKGENAAHFDALKIDQDDEALAELVGLAYVEVRGERVHLSREGRAEARMTVRRHRLAERLSYAGLRRSPTQEVFLLKFTYFLNL